MSTKACCNKSREEATKLLNDVSDNIATLNVAIDKLKPVIDIVDDESSAAHSHTEKIYVFNYIKPLCAIVADYAAQINEQIKTLKDSYNELCECLKQNQSV